MATITSNYQLIKPAISDYYDISQFNKNFDIIDNVINGASIKLIMKSDFDALEEKDNRTIYYVINDVSGTVSQYLGSTPVGGSGGSAYTLAKLYSNVANGIATTSVTKEDL